VTPIDIVLKIGADIRNAVTGMRQLGDEAETAGRKVDSVSTNMDRIRRGVATGVSAAAGFAGVVGGVAYGAQQFGDWVNNMLGGPAGEQNADFRQKTAANPAQAGDAFVGQVLARFRNRGNLGSGFRMLGDILTGKDNPLTAETRDSPELGRQARAAFQELALSDPARAADVLANLGGTRLEKYRGDFSSILARSNAAKGYEPGAATQITVNTGIGDRNTLGREVRAALDSRDRNNGRYVTTYTRR
jgi:hypothetical protein